MKTDLLKSKAEEIYDLLILALPYVEDGEQFNKPVFKGKLSGKIRALIEEIG